MVAERIWNWLAAPSHRLQLYVVVLRRFDHSDSHLVGLRGPSSVDASFGLVLRQATSDEVLDAGGNLIVDDILPGSPAAMSIMIQPGDRLLTVDREPVDWLRPDEVLELLSSLTECTLELGRLPIAPYPVDPGLSAACFPQDTQPPYPSSVELPDILDGEMPSIDPLPGVRTMEVLEEEEAKSNIRPIGLDSMKEPSAQHEDTQLSDSDSISSIEGEQQINDSSVTGFQVRQVYLPPPLPGQKLGIHLGKASGISGPVIVRIHPNSTAAQTILRVGDRILGLDDKLLLLVDSSTRPRQLLARIKETWLERGNDLENPVCLTVIGPPIHSHSHASTPSSSDSKGDLLPAASSDKTLRTASDLPASMNGPGFVKRTSTSQTLPTLRGHVSSDEQGDPASVQPVAHLPTTRPSPH